MQLKQNLKHFILLLLKNKKDIRILITEGNFAEIHCTDIFKVCISIQPQPCRSHSLQAGSWKIELELIVKKLKINMRTRVGIFYEELCVHLSYSFLSYAFTHAFSLWRRSGNASSSSGVLEHTLCNALFCVCIHKEATKRISRPQGLPITVNRVIQPHKKPIIAAKTWYVL